jgi:hypothetical protein
VINLRNSFAIATTGPSVLCKYYFMIDFSAKSQKTLRSASSKLFQFVDTPSLAKFLDVAYNNAK